jgi:branched-chain amino acid transport system substrate-binding protein
VATLGARASQAAEPYRIGALNPVTGPASPYGTGMQKSIFFAADEVNAAGGAAGRRFQVFGEDEQSNPDAAVLAAKKLVEINKCEAILGVWTSSCGLAILPYTNAANKILMVCGGATEYSKRRKNDLSWRFMTDSAHMGIGYARAAKRVGAKRAAVMALNNPSAIDGIDSFSKQWKEWGMPVVARVVYEPKQASYRSEIQQILAAKPDIIVAHSFLTDTTVFLREWYELGGTNKWIMPGFSANSNLIKALGKDVTNGILALQIIPAEGTPAFDRYAKKYQEVMHKPVGDNIYAVSCYDMVIALALAIEQAGPTADDLKIAATIRTVTNAPGTKVSTFAEGKKLIRQGKKVNYEGAFGPLEFNDTGDPVPVLAIDEIKDGKLVRLWRV